MVEGKYALWNIPYDCISCKDKPEQSWITGEKNPEQKIYNFVKECEYN